jgi:hypothetical protein
MFEGDASAPTIEQQSKSEPVANTTTYGKTTIDDIYQGLDCFAQFVALEYKAGSIAAWWPWTATIGQLGVIARLGFAMSAALVMTVVAGTPAAGSPNTVTAPNSLLLPGYSSRLVYGPTLRKLPIRMRLYPFSSSGTIMFWTQT